jgi:hypothetical protein
MPWLSTLCGLLECTVGDREQRKMHLEFIAHHLACTDMNVHIKEDTTVRRVEFPTRPKVQ